MAREEEEAVLGSDVLTSGIRPRSTSRNRTLRTARARARQFCTVTSSVRIPDNNVRLSDNKSRYAVQRSSTSACVGVTTRMAATRMAATRISATTAVSTAGLVITTL